MCEEGPVLLLLGTAQGLAPEVLARCDGVLRPIRYLGYNHLSVRSAPLSWPTEFWAITSKRHSFSSRRQPSQGCVFKE